jgi:anti-sigma regulatory factor (Ser/Thr protein kinase)
MNATAPSRSIDLSAEAGVARRQVAETLDEAGWRGDVDGVLLAVHEALVNAKRHAGGVTRATACLEGDAFVVEVWDRGKGFRMPRSKAAPDTMAERGRGLFLIRRLATDVSVSESAGETGLRLRFEP